MGFLRASFKAFFLLSWFLFIVFTGLIYVMIFNQQPNRWLHIFWKGVAWLVGLRLKMSSPVRPMSQVVFIANHISYLDIIVMGAAVNPVFIGKKEIKSWPILGFAADKIAGIFYIDRRISQIAFEKKRLAQFVQKVPRTLLFFPEGTTSEGVGVGEFKPALFDMLLDVKEARILPLTIRYTHLNGRKIETKSDRRKVAWYNDVDPKVYPAPTLLGHLWSVLKLKRLDVDVRPFAKYVKVSDFSDRRALALACFEAVKKNF